MDFEEIIFRSVKQLKNPVIFVPDLLFIVATIALSAFFFKFSGLNSIISSLALTEDFQSQLFNGLFADKWATIIIGTVLFFVMFFILGVTTDLLRFNLVKDVIAGKKKATLAAALRDSSGMFWDVVGLKILVYLLSLVVLLATAALGLVLYLAFGKLSLVPTAVLAVFGIGLLVMLKLYLLFRYPVLFVDRMRNAPMGVIKESFAFAKKHIRHTVMAILVLLLVFVLFNVVTLPVTLGLEFLKKSVALTGVSAIVLAYLAQFVASAVNLVYSLWMHLFVFNSYVGLKKFKN